MNLAQLQSSVIELTKRPDLAALTFSAIQAATLKMHHSDYYAKDLTESGVEFSTATYLQTLEYRSVFPRWRALKYIRCIDSTSLEPYGPSLTVISPDSFMDSYSIEKENVVYEAGQTLEIRVRNATKYFLVGCYLHPDITAEGYSSWIADNFPFSIIYDATATVFKTIGYAEQEASMRNLVGEQIALLKISNIQAVGY